MTIEPMSQPGSIPGMASPAGAQPRWAEPPAYTHVVVFEATLEARSPVAIGEGESDRLGDAPMLLDVGGKPYVPGTTLAGVLRSRVEAQLRIGAGASSVEETAFYSVFGGRPGDDDGAPGALSVDDAYLVGEAVTEIRDHVCLEEGAGVAADGKKYDREVVAAGSRFALRLEWRTGRAVGEASKEEQRVVRALLAALEGGIRVGSRTRRGLGDLAVSAEPAERWRVASYDLTSGSGLAAWVSKPDSALSPSKSVEALVERFGWEKEPLPGRDEIVLTLDLRVVDTLLIRAPGRLAGTRKAKGSQGQREDSADASHLQRLRAGGEAQAIVSATSLAGALRHRCLAIGEVILRGRGAEADASGRVKELVSLLFGQADPEAKGQANTGTRKKTRAGLVRIDEAVIEGGSELRHTRVVIDPWTGGALEGYLFSEDVRVGGKFKLEVAIERGRAPARTEAERTRFEAAVGLLFLALRDVWEGDMPIGGEVGVGRGVVVGVGGSLLDGGAGEETLDFDAAGRLTSGGSRIAAYVQVLNRHLSGTTASAPGEAR